MSALVSEFQLFAKNSEPDKPKDSSKASGSPRLHYGLSNPTMRAFVKEFAANNPDISYEEWLALMDGLYQGESIDERCFAGFMLGQYNNFRNRVSLDTLDKWIGQLEGWREIDTTCQSNYTAKDVLSKWEAWDSYLRALAVRETISHRRASLVLLVKPVRDSEDSRLIETALANVDAVKHETDILITKAISWILRESIKRHRERVRQYVDQNTDNLPAIAIREFEKKYTIGKK